MRRGDLRQVDLRGEIEAAMDRALMELPPAYRAMAQPLPRLLRTYLQSTSDEQLWQMVRALRDQLNEVLG